MNHLEQIKEWRDRMGWSQSRAAQELQISVRTLQDWEQGRFEPPSFLFLALRAIEFADVIARAEKRRDK